MAFVDLNTLNVLTVLFIDMGGAIIIFLGFLYVRSLRGDRKIVRSSFTNKMVTEVVFEESQLENSKADEEGVTNRLLNEKDKQNYLLIDTKPRNEELRKSKNWWLSSDSDQSQDHGRSGKTGGKNAISTYTLGQSQKETSNKGLRESELPLLRHQQRLVSIDIEKPKITPYNKESEAEEEKQEIEFERESEAPKKIETNQSEKEQAQGAFRKFSILQKFRKFKHKQNHPSQGGINKETVTTDGDDQPSGMLDWLHILRGMKDQDLKLICGTDAALFIVFQRLAAKFFALLTIINFAVFIPLYVTGFPQDPADVQDPNGDTCLVALTTIMNITGNDTKVTIVYFLINSIYLGAALGFMYFYWKRSVEWRYKKHSHKQQFVDHDIALHSIMVTGINNNIDMQSAREHIDLVFHKLFPDGRVISTRIIGKSDRLYTMALRLKEHKKYYRFYRRANRQARNEGDDTRKMFYKNKGCCKGLTKFDAEEYFKKKIRKRCLQIKSTEDQLQKINGGIGFVNFISNLQVKQCLHKNFKNLLQSNLTEEEITKTQANTWTIRQAPSQSDIIWENIYNNDILTIIKSYFLIVVLFVTCVLIVTPVSILDNLQPILNFIFAEIGETNIISVMIQTYISPIILLIFNSGIVPVLIDIVAALEGHKLKSLKQLGIMRKNFFFMLMNVVFLQLTAQATVLSFLDYSLGNQFFDLPKALGKNLVNNNYFFLRFTIQLTFISNGIQLLDIPHHSIKILKYAIYKIKQKKEIIKQPFVDNFAYDLGYYQSQTIVVFALGLIFSGTMPLISLFATMFFGIRYYIEKYNLTFAYNKEFEGGGVIKKQVIPFMMLSIYLFEFLNLGYFTFKFGDVFFKWGLAFIAGQTLLMIFLNTLYSTKKRRQRADLASQVEQLNSALTIEEYHKQNQKMLRQEEDEMMKMEKDNKEKNKIQQFIDTNVLLSTERRLTLANQQILSEQNTEILKQAYRHPFEKIPQSYFDPNLGY